MQRRPNPVEVERFLDAWFRVRQLIQAANFNRFQSAGLSATQFMTLNLVPEDGPGVSMGELARRMNLASSTVAKTVDSLEARRLVARLRNAKDGRSVLLRATAQGRRLQNAAAGQFRQQISGMFVEMSPGERSGLIAGLEALVRVSNDAVPHADQENQGTGAEPGRTITQVPQPGAKRSQRRAQATRAPSQP